MYALAKLPVFVVLFINLILLKMTYLTTHFPLYRAVRGVVGYGAAHWVYAWIYGGRSALYHIPGLPFVSKLLCCTF